MEASNFSLIHLLPKFSEIADGNLNTSHGLSAAIVSFLLVVAIVFFCFALWKYFCARSHIGFYMKLLKEVNQENLAARQRDFTQQALQHNKYGKLWREFDETLVYSHDGTRLFNTLDAEHFFNTTSLSQGLTENRLLAAVPGFLTAIGVIGTFAGLQMGLAVLELNQDAGVDALRAGIGHMIKGASIAFLTSVWGVFTSLIFNFVEKILERGIRKRILELQNRIDYLYPRINAEQSLVTIADCSKSSSETLQGLAEKIGDKLQEALAQTTDSIRNSLEDSLNQIMAPAIKSLVDNANNSSQQVLETLLNRFLDGIGQAGDSQRQMMTAASGEVQEAMVGFGEQMNMFLGHLETQAQQVGKESSERQLFLEKQLSSLSDAQSERHRQVGEQFQTILGDLSTSFNRQLEEADAREKARQGNFESELRIVVTKNNEAVVAMKDAFSGEIEAQNRRDETRQENFENHLRMVSAKNHEMIDTMGEAVTQKLQLQQQQDEERHHLFTASVSELQQSQKSITEQVAALVTMQDEIFEKLQGKLGMLLEQFNRVAGANSQAAGEILKATQQMQIASGQLGLLSANLKQATDQLADHVGSAAATTASLAAENLKASVEVRTTLDDFRQLSQNMAGTADLLKEAAHSAENGFSAVHTHFDGFKKAMENHIVDLEEHLKNLLVRYAEQVQSQTAERLNVWNEQTNEYISSMSTAVRVISDVVDGMETKCSVS